MSDTAIILLSVASALCGLTVGYVVGSKAGRDEQWCDDFISACRKDAERRDKAGRFCERRHTE